MNNENDQNPERERTDTVSDVNDEHSVLDNNGPSLENPTWDYLFNNFNKIQLQKHCRSLGLTRIWTTKDKLVDMIIAAQHPPRAQNVSDDEERVDSLQNIFRQLREMRELISIKDSEIEELNILVKTANVTINRLSDRVTALEEKVKENEINVNEPTRRLPFPPCTPERILLIGDNNLNDVSSSDLGENCLIRTLQEATVDLCRCWINEQLDWTPSRCILYCGMHDLMEGSSVANILDDLGALVTDLKAKNEAMEIMVCELAPSISEDMENEINKYNEKLNEWSTVNGISTIKTNLIFKLGTGDVDEMCFKMHSASQAKFLNRFGVLRLLTKINKQCENFKLSVNCNNIISNHNPSTYASITLSDQPKTNRNPSNRRLSVYYDGQDAGGGNREHQGRNHYRGKGLGEPSFARRYIRTNNNSQFEDKRPRYSNGRLDSRGNNRRYAEHESYWQGHSIHRYQRKGEGCFNCGERNHRSDTCRYDHKLRCTNCHQLGHKSRLCKNYSYNNH